MPTIQHNIQKILATIGNAKLIIVTKKQSPDTLKELLTVPELTDIGENRWQDFKERFLTQENLYEQFKNKKTKFHFIGHLQTNKVKDILPYFDVIQSVDSLKLLEKINSEAEKIDKVQSVLLEVNISGDELKHGFTPEEIQEILEHTAALPHIQVDGLMTILKQGLTPEEQKEYFTQLKELTKEHNLTETSMGMSQDYKIAIEAGATVVRIGSAVFT